MDIKHLDTTGYIAFRPQAVAKLCHLPLSVASYLVKEGPVTRAISEDDARAFVERYLAQLPVPQEFRTKLFRHGMPILNAYVDYDGFLHTYCIWCREFHHHGKGEGGRAPHCEWLSPWRRIGTYHLSVSTFFSPEISAMAPSPRYPLSRAYIEAPALEETEQAQRCLA